ncbi:MULTISPECIES: Dps family protein [Paenibacillus]|uniref:Dps family protein n=3 Tax=Paenibacillus TaxID=44249 RepID=A0ABU3RM54_9BACL|nr:MULTISPECIES: Dps family protein [Paenibacillus]MBA2944109.1 DNA starvation/stationary phase protection protein [Paenibacillus sp. CGMCC 1.16610]MCY9661209.1 DNA starvation/stationary phase protection protein [Paenibacillus anseongense]MDU0205274.1 Dps family protein [Paenibacillus sp. PFR10]MEB4797327.1 DNA starvation/stationary phase protection protein [Paenibacillus chondroitinus]MEC0268353.1 DNA starvation/stationary phase protection protein [Paenibacillus anseongense]
MATTTLTSAQSIQTILNKQIANWGLLFVKLHNFHWYVKGNQFFTLHVKFEELYNEAALHIDELAERLLSIGGQPAATMKAYIELSSLKEAQGTETATKMVEAVIEDFTILTQELKAGMQACEEVQDETTSDMLLAIQTSLEKHRWMLQSFLG